MDDAKNAVRTLSVAGQGPLLRRESHGRFDWSYFLFLKRNRPAVKLPMPRRPNRGNGDAVCGIVPVPLLEPDVPPWAPDVPDVPAPV